MKLTKKLLTPAKFGLNTMKPMKSDEIVNAVIRKLISLDITPATKDAMKHMLKSSEEGIPKFDADFTGLTGADVGILTSDFGEICGAVYMLNSNMGYTAAKFPTSEAQRLVDYFLVKNRMDEGFSAKAGQGGAPAINVLEKKLQEIDMKSLSNNHKKALKTLQIISKETIYDGSLVAAEFLKLPGYDALLKILKRRELKTGYSAGIPQIQHLLNAIDSVGSYEKCLKQFDSFMKASDFRVGKDEKMISVFSGKASSRYKKWGLLHFPITSQVMSWLNDKNNKATEVLTMAANSLSVNQIYLDSEPNVTGNQKWFRGTLKYTVKTFSDAEFKFHSPSSTPNPVGNRIGIKMIKTPKKSS
jgi:hypothetical protein